MLTRFARAGKGMYCLQCRWWIYILGATEQGCIFCVYLEYTLL
jgi:hypothetical protein